MRLVVKTYGLTKLSDHDMAGVANASQWKLASINEWAAALAARFEAKDAFEFGADWTVSINDAGTQVTLRHHRHCAVLTVYSIT